MHLMRNTLPHTCWTTKHIAYVHRGRLPANRLARHLTPAERRVWQTACRELRRRFNFPFRKSMQDHRFWLRYKFIPNLVLWLCMRGQRKKAPPRIDAAGKETETQGAPTAGGDDFTQYALAIFYNGLLAAENSEAPEDTWQVGHVRPIRLLCQFEHVAEILARIQGDGRFFQKMITAQESPDGKAATSSTAAQVPKKDANLHDLAIAMVESAPAPHSSRTSIILRNRGRRRRVDSSSTFLQLPDTTAADWKMGEEMKQVEDSVRTYWRQFSQQPGSYLLAKFPSDKPICLLCQVEDAPIVYLPVEKENQNQRSNERCVLVAREPQQSISFAQHRLVRIVARVDAQVVADITPTEPGTSRRLTDSELLALLHECGLRDLAVQSTYATALRSFSSTKVAKRKRNDGEGEATTEKAEEPSAKKQRKASEAVATSQAGSAAGLLPPSVAPPSGRGPMTFGDLHLLLKSIFAAKRTNGKSLVKQKDLRQTRAGDDRCAALSMTLGATRDYVYGCTLAKDTRAITVEREGEACYAIRDVNKFMQSQQLEIVRIRAPLDIRSSAQRVPRSGQGSGLAPSSSSAASTSSSSASSSVKKQNQRSRAKVSASNDPPVSDDADLPRLLRPFVYSSVQTHQNALTYPHRDRGNVGESVVVALGDFAGGGLFIYDNNIIPGQVTLDALNAPEVHEPVNGRIVRLRVPDTIATSDAEKRRLYGADQQHWPTFHRFKKKDVGGAGYFILGREYSAKNRLLRFDAGRNIHATMPFEGDRYCCVFFLHSALPQLRTFKGRGGFGAFDAFLQSLDDLAFPVPECRDGFWLRVGEGRDKPGAYDVIELSSDEE